jgi:hypothetical protein
LTQARDFLFAMIKGMKSRRSRTTMAAEYRMNSKKWIEELRRTCRTYGLRAAAHDFGCRAIDKVARLQILKGMTVRMEDIRDQSLFEARDFETRFATEEELAKHAQTGEHEFSPAFLRRAFGRGDRCYALFDRGGNLAAHGWYSNLPTPIDDRLVLHFDPGYTYMYKGFTLPAYRGKRLHAVGMCCALRAVTEEGKVGLISWVYSNNFASLRSVERMGYRIFGSVYAVQAGNANLTFATAGCRERGFRLEIRSATTDVPPPSRPAPLNG